MWHWFIMGFYLLHLLWLSISLPGPVGMHEKQFNYNIVQWRDIKNVIICLNVIYKWISICMYWINEKTHWTIGFTRLNTARIIISNATSCVTFSFSPHVNLLENLDISSHAGRKLSTQMNQVGCSWTYPKVGWLLIIHLLQWKTCHENLKTNRLLMHVA